jgi:hypothetical protein
LESTTETLFVFSRDTVEQIVAEFHGRGEPAIVRKVGQWLTPTQRLILSFLPTEPSQAIPVRKLCDMVRANSVEATYTAISRLKNVLDVRAPHVTVRSHRQFGYWLDMKREEPCEELPFYP